MRPAPRKPTPEGIAADTRDASQLIGPAKNPNVELMVNRALPKLTNATATKHQASASTKVKR